MEKISELRRSSKIEKIKIKMSPLKKIDKKIEKSQN